jgi:alkyl sulfatase BDS1-like metallo-beta-lactamase superfamily hydrolase
MRVILLLMAGALAGWSQYLNPEKSLRKVTDHVYVATGYALGNAIYVITDKSVVVVDTTESPRGAGDTR